MISVALVATVLWSLGWRTVTDHGQLLGNLRVKAEKFASKSKLAFYLLKPTILCVVCYGSFWGQVIFWSLVQFSFDWVLVSIWVSVSACFLNWLVWEIFVLIQQKANLAEAQTKVLKATNSKINFD